MDPSFNAARGKGRASARKRHTLPALPFPQPGSGTITAAEPFDQPPSSTPANSIVSSYLSLETPSPTASRGIRARARVAEGAMPSSDDLDGKGGRSLRKRPRVDYTFENPDEYVSDSGKMTPSLRTPKRRRTDSAIPEMDDEEDLGGSYTKRRSSTSDQLIPPSASLRKRNSVRKSLVELQNLIADEHAEDTEVHDTIEVGGHHSEQSDESTLKRASSNTSSRFSNDEVTTIYLTSSPKIPNISSTPRKPRAGFIRAGMNKNRGANVQKLRASHTSQPMPVAEEPLKSSHDHLTPYIDNVFVEWPAVRAEAEPTNGPQPLQRDAIEETADDQLDGAQLDSFKLETTHEETTMVDPFIFGSTPMDGTTEETPVLSPLPIDTRANSPTADIETTYNQPSPGKPISFKKTRSASEFAALFEDHKSLSPEEIWTRLAVVNRALVAWQDEYNNLRKITDDEDNAVRYRQEEAAFEQRVKMHTSKDPYANPVRKDFIVKGIRAERPNPEIAYARYQDKLMAANYYFDYDDRDSKIGCQDPAEQKTGAGKGRLRDRPKQTAKAAEADDSNVIQGKRLRKPAILFDGSEAASRGSTPVPTQRRRRQAGHPMSDISEVTPIAPASIDLAPEQVPLKKKGKGGRPRKHPLPVPVLESSPVPAEETQQLPEPVEEEKSTRKRQRRRTLVDVPDVEVSDGAEEEPVGYDNDQQGSAKAGPRRTNSRILEVPSGSFYTSSLQSNNVVDDSRPPTSSSTATQSTMASNNYQLREKRQKKFSLNPEDEGYDVEPPKPKRVKRSKKTHVEDLAATALPIPIPSPMPPQQPVFESHPIPKPPTKIRLKNYIAPVAVPPITLPTSNPFSVPSSSSSTPPHSANGAGNNPMNGADPADLKDYNQMTKSEKMSHSMKARWASGSMSQAVAKRRATLANKKQAVKAADPSQPLESSPAAKQS